MYAASLAITRAYKPMLDALGITYPQYLVLHALWEADERSVGAIAERLSLEPSTLTPLLKRLEGAGLVRRVRNPRDERQVKVSLTAEGLALREDCGALGEALAARSGMTARELAALRSAVEALRLALIEKGKRTA